MKSLFLKFNKWDLAIILIGILATITFLVKGVVYENLDFFIAAIVSFLVTLWYAKHSEINADY